MSALKIGVINEALLLIGDRPLSQLETVSSTDDPSASVLAAGLYDLAVDAAFSRRFRFCMSSEELTEIADASLIPAGFDRLFQRPTEAITTAAVVDAEGRHVYFDVFGDTIAVKGVGTDTLWCHYTVRVTENFWPPNFRLGVVMTLASYFAMNIVENARLSAGLAEQANAAFAQLASSEAQGRTPRSVDLTYLHRGRRGSGRTYRPPFTVAE